MCNTPELNWMKEAKRHLGMHEIKHAHILADWQKELNCSWLGVNPAWCGIYVAKCLKMAGVKYPKEFFRAASYRTFGTQLTRPAYGCLAIKTRKGGNHVCFVVGKTKQNKLVCLGGNQSNSVCYVTYDINDFDSFVWVGTQRQPAPHRYTLDILNVQTKTQVSEA